eukprot:NODE_841_length_740_cov_1.280389_g832_i0.p2 GENE.NODE_841_length_740_cov_1.280389_g832_i0~~NODE_841_length_740_cov_1.280389_g832_i0.p2  ORF type:complete len:107 (-),score=13.65 NODE_841_length_740_cov_1.280389_g832_i0:174-494(-)
MARDKTPGARFPGLWGGPVRAGVINDQYGAVGRLPDVLNHPLNGRFFVPRRNNQQGRGPGGCVCRTRPEMFNAAVRHFFQSISGSRQSPPEAFCGICLECSAPALV